MANMPMIEIVCSTFGMAVTNPWPNLFRNAFSPADSFNPTSSIFTNTATAPYTMAVTTKATTISTTSCIQKLLVATSFSEITMISADKIKSVVIAPRTNVFSSFAAAFSSASSL